MRAPPPVHVDAGGGPAWRAVRAGLVAAAVGVPLAWAAPWIAAAAAPSSPDGPAPGVLAGATGLLDGALMGAAALVALAAGCIHWRSLSRLEQASPAARLRWEGAAWSLLPAPQALPVPGSAWLVLDLGGWMLVRFHAADPASRNAGTWLPVRRARDEAGWRALRAALWTWRAEAPEGARR